jgi:NADH dehydrogenase
MITNLEGHPGFTFLQGSIFDTNSYAPVLSTVETIIHLAAVTGKAKKEEYEKVNAEGTRILIGEGKKAGLKNILFISTIAAKFEDISNYYYAQSKLAAEKIVRDCGLNFSIVRPTIVIGPQSPILKTFLGMQIAEMIPVFGDGHTKIQPVFADDLVDCLLSVLYNNDFLGETYEVGGPEIVSIEEFIRKIFCIAYGKEPATVHIPMKLMLSILSVLEQFFYDYLPFNSGQLSSFRFDGIASDNKYMQEYQNGMKSIEEMIKLSIDNET